jgi:thiamine-phosphate pyrophosphorylase
MRTLVIINDRPDIAALADADGVHLGQDDLRVKDAREIVGPRRLIGVSTHSIDQARTAVLNGANYLGVGPTFPSQTKSFDEFPGLEFVREVAAEIRLPAFAIGGVTLQNVGEVIAAGLPRAAVASAVTAAAKPQAAATALRAVLHQ